MIITLSNISDHDDVIKLKYFPHYWSFVRGIHRSHVNSPHKGQWRGALMFSLVCAWMNGWVNNGKAGDLRRQRAHYDAFVMSALCHWATHWWINFSTMNVTQYPVLHSTCPCYLNTFRYLCSRISYLCTSWWFIALFSKWILRQISQLSFLKYMGPCVFSLHVFFSSWLCEYLYLILLSLFNGKYDPLAIV